VFQSTRPRGARQELKKCEWCQRFVSIHAPARGATSPLEMRKQRQLFQSTRPRGARHAPTAATQYGAMFQSTRPRGARRRPGSRVHGRYPGFNPRAREGRDTLWPVRPTSSTGFNPRAREGRDLYPLHEHVDDAVSIHAPARGATTYQGFYPFARGVSIHAPARGATPKLGQGFTEELVSIHAPARGATTPATTSKSWRTLVSIHAPARGATRPATPAF